MNNDDAMPTPIPQSAPHHSTTTGITAKTASSIVNPYLKKDETEIANETDNVESSSLSSKRNFITKYSHHGSGNVPDVMTAAKIRRKRLRSIGSANESSSNGGSGYSLCLFRDHCAADGQTDSSSVSKKLSNDDNNIAEYAIPLDNDITELSGEGGSGKTQTCLSLALDCVTRRRCQNNDNANQPRRHPNGYTNTAADTSYQIAVYITTKSSPSTLASRLRTMMHTRLLNAMASSSADNTPTTADRISTMIQSTLERIYLIPILNEEQLLEFLTVSLSQLFQFHNDSNNAKIGLIVLDDIATLYRFADTPLYEDGVSNNGNYTQSSSSLGNNTFVRERTGDLWRISSTLRHLAFQYSVPVIIVNQVTSAIPSTPSYNDSLEHGGVLPALGLVWSHCVGMRVMLCKSHRIIKSQNTRNQDDGKNDTVTTSACLRYARVLQAVNVQEEEVGFVVEDGGVRWIRKGWR